MSGTEAAMDGSAAERQRPGALLITGGAGFVGEHFIRRVSGEGYQCIALYRHKLPETLENVFPVAADMSTPELLAAPLRGVSTVVHLAWEGGLNGPSGTVFGQPLTLLANAHSGNLTSLRNLLSAMEKAGTRRIVFLSSAGADRNSESGFHREKYLAEHLILNSGIPEKVIIRSAVIWGGQYNSDRFMQSLTRVMRFAIYPVPRAEVVISPVHVRDVCSTLLDAVEKDLGDDSAAVVRLTGADVLSTRELCQIVSKKCIKRPQVAVGGFLGETLLPFFERRRKEDKRASSLTHFIDAGRLQSSDSNQSTAFSSVIPAEKVKFGDSFFD